MLVFLGNIFLIISLPGLKRISSQISHLILVSFSISMGFHSPVTSQAPSHIVWKVIHLHLWHIPSQYQWTLSLILVLSPMRFCLTSHIFLLLNQYHSLANELSLFTLAGTLLKLLFKFDLYHLGFCSNQIEVLCGSQ